VILNEILQRKSSDTFKVVPLVIKERTTPREEQKEEDEEKIIEDEPLQAIEELEELEEQPQQETEAQVEEKLEELKEQPTSVEEKRKSITLKDKEDPKNVILNEILQRKSSDTFKVIPLVIKERTTPREEQKEEEIKEEDEEKLIEDKPQQETEQQDQTAFSEVKEEPPNILELEKKEEKRNSITFNGKEQVKEVILKELTERNPSNKFAIIESPKESPNTLELEKKEEKRNSVTIRKEFPELDELDELPSAKTETQQIPVFYFNKEEEVDSVAQRELAKRGEDRSFYHVHRFSALVAEPFEEATSDINNEELLEETTPVYSKSSVTQETSSTQNGSIQEGEKIVDENSIEKISQILKGPFSIDSFGVGISKEEIQKMLLDLPKTKKFSSDFEFFFL